MTAVMVPQGMRRALIVATLISIIGFMLFMANQSSYISIPSASSLGVCKNPSPSHSFDAPPGAEALGDFVDNLFQPQVHPVDHMNFTNMDGKVFRLSKTPQWTKSLGKKMVILDIDSRPLDKEGELLHGGPLKWQSINRLTAGMLSHYLYAKIHGYDYKLIRAPDYEDRYGTWVKVPIMKEVLKTHEYLVFMDSDVVITYPHLPIEWLMNYWNMANDTLVMMARDPDEPQNYNDRHEIYLNTGFVIAQNSSRTQEMYEAWANCPGETRYPGCKHWKHDWPQEQAAFGTYLMYDFNRTNDIIVLPCAEANGAPEAENRGGCIGTFVRHYWVDKGLVPKQLSDSIMQYVLPMMYSDYHLKAEQNIVDATGFKFVGAEVEKMTEEEKEELKEKKAAKKMQEEKEKAEKEEKEAKEALEKQEQEAKELKEKEEEEARRKKAEEEEAAARKEADAKKAAAKAAAETAPQPTSTVEGTSKR